MNPITDKECAVFHIADGWVCGISDGLVLPCAICRKHTDFDYKISDELWNRVVPADMRLNVVCLPCLDKLAKKRGYIVSQHLQFVQFTGQNETIVLKPEIAFTYEQERKHANITQQRMANKMDRRRVGLC